MEEKKTKQVDMKGKAEEKQQRLSYEQLNDVCSQLYQQNQQLSRQLQQLNMSNMFKRLDYLFQVLNYSSIIKDPDFINNCISEIKEAMTIKNEAEEVKTEKEG